MPAQAWKWSWPASKAIQSAGVTTMIVMDSGVQLQQQQLHTSCSG